MSLSNSKMSSLKDKLEEKAILVEEVAKAEEAVAKVDDAIDEIAGEKKAKIKRVSLKKAK